MPHIKTAADALVMILDRRKEEEADLRDMRVLGRNSDGTTRLQPLNGECELRGPLSGLQKGRIVQQIPSALSSRGAAGFSLGGRGINANTLWIELPLDPPYFTAGESLTVTVSGHGFTATTTIEFLEPGSDEINEDITITDQRLISANAIEIDITVSVTAATFTDPAGIAYDD